MHDPQTERPNGGSRSRFVGLLRAWSSAALWATIGGALLEIARSVGALMADPASSAASATASAGIVAVALVYLFGPNAPEFAAIAVAALIGAAVQVSKMRTESRMQGFGILLGYAGMSTCFTGLAVWLLQAKAGVGAPPMAISLAVAAGLAAWGNTIYGVIERKVRREGGK